MSHSQKSAKKIYRLADHPEHQAALKANNARWIQNAFSTKPMDDEERALCKEAVKGLYRAANLEPPKDSRIVFVPSPFVLRFAGGFASAIEWLKKNPGKASSVGATYQATHQATGEATDQATDQATGEATRQATHQATDQATGEATRQATHQATYQATYQATDQATDQATYQATRQATYQATDQATYQATYQATGEATRQATRQATYQATDQATYQATDQATYQATDQATYQATGEATYQATRQATGEATSNNKSWFQFPVEQMVKLARDLGISDFGLRCAGNIWNYMWQGGNQWTWTEAFVAYGRDVAKLGETHGIDYSKYEHWEQLALHSGPRVVHPDFCIISDRPTTMKVNARNQAHCETGPYCEWRDGSSLYALNGIHVPAWVVHTKPDAFTREQITKETNADTRREIVRKIGNRRLLEVLDAKVLAESDEYQVLSFDVGDGRVRPFIKMTCPSSKLVHVLGVKPEMKSVEVAMAYNFNQEEEGWRRPLLEDGIIHGGKITDFKIGQTIARHGDVLLKLTGRRIADVIDKVLEKAVLHAGNNHNHDISGRFYLREEAGKRFVGLVGPCQLGHDEHGAQMLGAFEGMELQVDIAQEYDHWLEESRQVID